MKILWKETLSLWAFCYLKIWTIWAVRPRVLKINQNECEIMIPLNWTTRNHLRSMYFGVLAIGADCAGGLLAMRAIRERGLPISLVFKDFKAEFFKRPEADVHFICEDGKKTLDQIEETLKTGKRVNRTAIVLAKTPSKTGDEVMARFELTLSLKASKKL